MSKLAKNGADLAKGLFEYNRKNFLEDREQRQAMEYQVMEMRIKQTDMWREDIREIIEFTQTKVEMYMLVSTLLLGFCATAIVKAVVVEGTPSWLATAHTLMLTGAFMFLLISMILGINAYVASQAYAVRLLTQYVRLPIPTWKAIEASRTYGSTYEKQRSMQMFRTPFAMGKQENLSEDPRRDTSSGDPVTPPRTPRTPRSPKAKDAGGDDSGNVTTSDPWGLERRGDDIPELHPLVNVQCARQRHVWLAREAGKFYLTHEAFCRVAMNLGTSYLSLFFSYYCLTYCLVEDGAPQAAFAGMIIFVVLSLIIVFMDKVNNTRELVVFGFIQSVAPVLSFICTYVSMPNGYGGIWEYIVCIGQFTQGLWLLLYLRMLRVRETDTGVFFPMGFKTALLLDTFGRHPHRARQWQSGKSSMARGESSKLLERNGASKSSKWSEEEAPLPAMTFVNGPFRPEDLNVSSQGALDKQSNAWGPDSFFAAGAEEEQKGNICHGQKPGSQVWSVFRFSVWMLTLAWWLAGIFAFYQACIHESHFRKVGMTWEQKAENSPIVSVALQTGFATWRSERIQTSWPSAMARPQGLACDPSGVTFATFGRGKGGRRAVLHGRVSEETAQPPRGYGRSKLAFSMAPSCPGLEAKGHNIQDLALHKCAEMSGCAALVLPQKGESLVSCRLEGDEADIMDDVAPGLGLFQRQAIYRRINKDDTTPNVDRVVMQESFKNVRKDKSRSNAASSDILASGFRDNASIPLARAWLDDLLEEEPSSLSVAACEQLEGGPSECPILGTTAGRIVQMAPGRAGDSGQEAWVPRSVLLESRDATEPGSMVNIGSSLLGVLQKNSNQVSVVNSAIGGVAAKAMRLPKAPKGLNWASVCAGGDSVYALESGEDPVIWRFSQK